MRKFLQIIEELIKDKNLIDARRLLNLGNASDSKKMDWKVYQFIIAVKNNQLALAVIYLQEVLKYSDAPSDLYSQFGELHIRNNNLASALAIFHKGLLKFPLSKELLSKYIQCAQLLQLTNSKVLQQRAGLLLSLIKFDSLELIVCCCKILVEKDDEIGA
ncbi:MAG: hypothetical protein KAU26_06050, partial [Methylococcales bacterium]|nr:hypothetical protein [Methylococcales bacterium]